MNRDALIHILQNRIPNLLAIYAFGSRIQGKAQLESDLDLAVLVAGHAEPLTLWELAATWPIWQDVRWTCSTFALHPL